MSTPSPSAGMSGCHAGATTVEVVVATVVGVVVVEGWSAKNVALSSDSSSGWSRVTVKAANSATAAAANMVATRVGRRFDDVMLVPRSDDVTLVLGPTLPRSPPLTRSESEPPRHRTETTRS
ncbi:MAG: hypothetical protein R2710_28925 [Acidimicrobiales bacterium]